MRSRRGRYRGSFQFANNGPFDRNHVIELTGSSLCTRWIHAPRNTILRWWIDSRKRRRCRTGRSSHLRLDDRSTRILGVQQRAWRVRYAPSERTVLPIPLQNHAIVRGWDGAVSWLVPRRCRYCSRKARCSEIRNRIFFLLDNHGSDVTPSILSPSIFVLLFAISLVIVCSEMLNVRFCERRPTLILF